MGSFLRITIKQRLSLIVLAMLVGVGVLAGPSRSAGQAVLVPPVEDLRFQLIGNEPIAAPDGRGLVRGWSVLVFKDRRAERCYVALQRGDSIAMEAVSACP